MSFSITAMKAQQQTADVLFYYDREKANKLHKTRLPSKNRAALFI